MGRIPSAQLNVYVGKTVVMNFSKIYQFILVFLTTLKCALCEADKSNDDHAAEQKEKIDQLELYKQLFQKQRVQQIQAVNNILSLDGVEKQYKMVKIVLEKLFSIMQESKVTLEEAGFSPGDPFPSKEDTKIALSNIAENTAIFGDILLRVPDITHTLYDKKKDWQLLAKWGIGFCNDTGIFVDSNAKLLHLMTQELGIVEKDPNYFNPYKDQARKMQKILGEEELNELSSKKKKKVKKEKKRGPRLSKSEL